MGRSKDKNSDENLRGHLRQLKSENKHLRRQVSRLEKQLARQPIDTIDEPEELDSVKDITLKEDDCPKCGKPMNLIDLGIRRVLSCKCGNRVVLKD